MRALLQRIRHASVSVDGRETGRAGAGLLIFLGVGRGDAVEDARALADRCVHYRIFEDGNGKMNRSLLDVSGEILVVSQFTLYADTSHGLRPGYSPAAEPETAEKLYEEFVRCLRTFDRPVGTGIFGADMQVSLLNDGPVTILLETKR